MPTALVIEDDLRIARVISLELTRAGWVVAHCQQGVEALTIPKTPTQVDAVVLDLMLPDIDGLVVCRTLRDRNPDVPILILSARSTVQDRVAGLESGADDYLVKPFEGIELLARLRAILRRAHPSSAADDWLTAGSIYLSKFRHEVRMGDVTINLTGREFSLLEYFLCNQDLILTRTMILEHVWGWGFQGTPGIIDVYVGYLRNKINGLASGVTLETVRGIGYVLRSQVP